MKESLQSRFNADFLEMGTEVLRAIAHPIRLTIIDLLYKNDKLSVTEIYEALNIEQAIASHHLRILKDKRVVAARREGKKSYYYLRSEGFHKIILALEGLFAR
jgi:DNA-binding transcriptional ArsR family regulator